MYLKLFQKVVFPTLDVLNGTHLRKVLPRLAESEWYSRDDLRALQREKLRRLLSWTEENAAFYRELWSNGGHRPGPPSRYPELDGLPVVGKEDLRARPEMFPLPAFRGRALKVQTSGSTGSPMIFYRSVEQESWFWALRIRMWQWAGFELGEPYLAVNLNARTAWKKRLQDLLFRCTYLTYNADTVDSARIVELLESRRFVHVNGFGSSLLALARYMTENAVAEPGVRVVTSTGDDLLPHDRETIEGAFGVKVSDYYGAGGEGMHLASQCEASAGYHVHMENSVVEVIRDGRLAQPGETGTIVVTQLDNHAMPLIRYDLGDLVTVGAGTACSCGRQHEMLESINGRACDVVYTPEGRALLPQFFFIGAFKLLDKVRRYQVVQERLSGITIRLVAEEGCDRRECENKLASWMEESTGGSLEVEFEWVPEIGLAGAGKPRPVVSRIERPSFLGR